MESSLNFPSNIANLSELIIIYSPWNQHKTSSFLMILRGIEVNIKWEICRRCLSNFMEDYFDTTQWSVKLMIHFPERAWELFRISNRNTTASFWRLCQDENYLLHILSFLFTDAFDLLLVLFSYQYQKQCSFFFLWL